MDKKRWLIIMSVFFSMTAVLFVLNLMQPVEKAQTKKAITKTAPKKQSVKDYFFTHSDDKTTTNRVKQYGEIRYPEPAKHTFNVENTIGLEKNYHDIKTKGKIIK